MDCCYHIRIDFPVSSARSLYYIHRVKVTFLKHKSISIYLPLLSAPYASGIMLNSSHSFSYLSLTATLWWKHWHVHFQKKKMPWNSKWAKQLLNQSQCVLCLLTNVLLHGTEENLNSLACYIPRNTPHILTASTWSLYFSLSLPPCPSLYAWRIACFSFYTCFPLCGDFYQSTSPVILICSFPSHKTMWVSWNHLCLRT